MSSGNGLRRIAEAAARQLERNLAGVRGERDEHMKIRRFVAADIREAMRQVREALGPDAVILETQRVEGGIELAAAVDYEPAAAEAAHAPERSSRAAPARDAERFAAASAGAPTAPLAPERLPDAAPVAPANEHELRGLRGEVRMLRALLETEVARLAWNDNVRRNAAATTTMRNLARLGIARDVVQQVIAAVGSGIETNSSWIGPLKQLEASIPVCTEDVIAGGGVFAVVGPTGVGKTTTIAKLAARYALTGRTEDIALVTTDTFRIGAREQLDTFGEILGSPVYQAGDADRLGEILRMLAGRRLVLIDTAGMGQRDVRLARQLSWLATADPRLQVLLALPANAQSDAQREIVTAFRVARPCACILTKTDEATSLGGAISALVSSGLPLAFVANGQRVPEDLHSAAGRQAWLVKSALELMKQREDCNEDFMAEHFGEVRVDACA
jgi:flagellar biosynthesis protein FlhF